MSVLYPADSLWYASFRMNNNILRLTEEDIVHSKVVEEMEIQ